MKRPRQLYLASILVLAGLIVAGCAQTLVFKGEAQLANKNYDEAIATFSSYLTTNPNDHQVRGRLGIAYLGKKETAKAIEAFRQVLAQVPDDPQASLHLGLALLETGNRRETIDLWRAYRNQQHPLVYQEVRRQLTLVEMVDGRELAREALKQEKKLQAGKAAPNTLAVTPYGDKPADPSLRPVQKALGAMITTDLAAIKALKVVERLRLQALIDEMKLGMSGLVEEKTAQRFGRLVGVEHLVTGTLAKKAELLRAATVLASTVKQKMSGSFGSEGEMAKFFMLEKEIVQGIVKALQLTPSAAEKTALEKPHTKNEKAFLCFGQGLDALDGGNWQQARGGFECAVKEDPQFVLAIEALLSCPADNAPPLATLLTMTPAQLAASAQAAIAAATAAQAGKEAEQAAAQAEANKGDGGGGGGGGGGH